MACILNGVTVVGDWVLNDPRGIRQFGYDSLFPDDFADLGTGRYDGTARTDGEIWSPNAAWRSAGELTEAGAPAIVDGLGS